MSDDEVPVKKPRIKRPVKVGDDNWFVELCEKRGKSPWIAIVEAGKAPSSYSIQRHKLSRGLKFLVDIKRYFHRIKYCSWNEVGAALEKQYDQEGLSNRRKKPDNRKKE